MDLTLARAVGALHITFAVFGLLAVEGEIVAGISDEWVLRPGDIGFLVLERRADAAPLTPATLRRKLGRAATTLREAGFASAAIYNYGDRVEILTWDDAA